MLKTPSSRRAMALGLGLATAVTATALPLLTPAAFADTAGNPATTTATTVTQTNITPQGPLNGLGNLSNIHVKTVATPGTNNGFEIRLCKGGINITGNSAFVPLQGGNCVLDPITAGSDAYQNISPDGALATAETDFKVGVGTETWATPGGNKTVACDFANPCSLWLKEQVGPGTYWTHYDLNFAAPPAIPATPAAPTVTLTGGGNTAHIVWTAPAASPAIDDYLVTPYIGGVAQAPIDTASTATTLDIPGLANFTSYTYTVTAHNSVGNSLESPQSAPPVTPAPGAPAAPNASSGSSGSADVTFPAVAGATGYVVSSTDTTTSTPGPTLTVATNSAHFTGLTNGDLYTFTFHAVYLANNGTESPASAPIKIGTKSVSQTIIASRPQGTLDIAERCSNGYTGGTFDGSSQVGGVPKPITPSHTTSYTGTSANPGGVPADGPAWGVYPQTCDVNLGTGVLNASSTYYVATGAIQTVSVRDLRDGDLGWNVNTQLNAFVGDTAGPGHSFPASCLALTPRYTELGNTPLYTQKVHVPTDTANDALTADTATAAIGGSCAGTGLAGATVQTALPAGGLGVAELDGSLTLNIPTSAAADTYTSTLTFTVLGN